MAPKKAGTRGKQAAGLAQPILSFQTRKPSAGGKKRSLTQSPSLASIKRTDSETSIRIDETHPEEPEVASHTKTTKPKEGNEKENKVRRQLDVSSKEWRELKKHAEVQMGGMKPIHAGPDTHNDIHHILRVFDLTSKYGPCVGITRLERWERAKKWGLSPPEEIKNILTTQQGEDDQVYRENVLYTWLG